MNVEISDVEFGTSRWEFYDVSVSIENCDLTLLRILTGGDKPEKRSDLSIRKTIMGKLEVRNTQLAVVDNCTYSHTLPSRGPVLDLFNSTAELNDISIHGLDTDVVLQLHSAEATLTGILVTNCSVSRSVMAVNSASLFVTSSAFTRNSGPLISVDDSSSATVDQSQFDSNTAGVWPHCGHLVKCQMNSSIRVNNSSFTNNLCQSTSCILVETSSALTIENSKFANNTGGKGGAISATSFSSLRLSKSEFHHNVAQYGGAVFAENFTFVSIANSVFLNNSAQAHGGALYVRYQQQKDGSFNPSSVTQNNTKEKDTKRDFNVQAEDTNQIDNCIFSANSARYGGALLGNRIKVDIISTTLEHNTATNHSGSGGGALYLVFSDVTITDSRFASNEADAVGGGIHSAGNQMTIRSSLFTENRAADSLLSRGGAIVSSDVIFTVINGTFRRNRAAFNGGAVLADRTSIERSVFVENSAGVAGGALSCGAGHITRSLFTNNSAANNGGALSLSGHARVNISRTRFERNAAGLGGAICSNLNDSVSCSFCSFVSNSAT